MSNRWEPPFRLPPQPKEKDMEGHFKLLGFRVRDVVTGFTGVVTSISFDLYGCVQALVHPEFDKKTGKSPDCGWYDLTRLEEMSSTPVMPLPSFDMIPGGQDKPAHPSKPLR